MDFADAVADLAAAGFVDALEIGRGGSGVVYRCVQSDLGRPVAVKVLAGLSEQDRARFVREQQAMGRVTGHPHIVAVLQAGQTASGCPFLVMPLCGRGSLQQRIAEHGALDRDEALGIGAKIADALAAAHRLGVVHRDVSPANILFTDYGEPALTDFGVAGVSRGFETAGQMLVGTPAFTAPELLDGVPPCDASDVYGLGATLFAALTGHAAFERHHGEQVVAQFVRTTEDSVPDLDLDARGIPAEVASIVAAAMSLDPAQRPSAAKLSEQLRRVRLHDSTGHAVAGTATNSTAGHLPVLPGEVVGRDAEVTEIGTQLASAPLLTLTGVGGVGKTTLAVHAATRLRSEYPDGVWLVELAELRDGALLSETVAAVLGVRDQPGRTLTEVVMAHLGQRHALLVLDNCEHLIDEVAKFVDTMLRLCPQMQVLATSRGILGIADETVLTVSPLAAPDTDTHPDPDTLVTFPAAELFLHRARGAVPNFRLTSHNVAAVAHICARVEGLPLAIELAAARLRAMSAQQIADGLTDRYSLLTKGQRRAPARHKSLAACIDTSYHLCTTTEQHLWTALAVFAGSFDLAAACHLAHDLADDGGVLDLVDNLVNKSVLIRFQDGDHVRFRLLETLRDYANTQITDNERHRLRARHADWYRRLLQQSRGRLFGHGQLFWSALLLQELPNIREALHFALDHNPDAALEMATAMRPVWHQSGMLGEARHWLQLAVAAAPHEPTTLRANALGDIAVIDFLRNDIAAACVAFDEAREHLAMLGDAELCARFDCIGSYIAERRGEIERAIEGFRRALAESRDFEVQWASTYSLGWIYEITGDLDNAMSHFETAVEFSTSRGESMYQSRALAAVGVVHWLRGDANNAEVALIEGLRLSHLVGDVLVGAQCLESLAWIAAARHDWRRAISTMAASDALSRAIGSPLMDIPDQVAAHDLCDSQCRRALDREAFEAAWAEGAALTFREAVALALGRAAEALGKHEGRAVSL
ncbi:protein kinase domain-containing protein [Mycobacterium camsae]|uniref:protein kinase domain-containing protein n=1 Tax=Mycobacterium gordonae TaxID=1778 RepID=UPI00197F5193|nr:protein kinase [Mycobacterium gordonae]